MDLLVVGIDVSKDWPDVAVRPTGESFTFRRTSVGIDDLIAGLKTLAPKMIAIEATGGFETVVAEGLAGAGLPVVVVKSSAGARLRPGARQTGQNRPN
jgi:transposase